MKKYLIFSTLAILFFLFGCEEEHALRLHTAADYYQGRAVLPNGQQIEMTETDRATVIDACIPESALPQMPTGNRQWLGTITLTRPLTSMTAAPAFPIATFFTIQHQAYVQCQAEDVTYVKPIEHVPISLQSNAASPTYYPDEAKLRRAQPNEQARFVQEMKQPTGNEPYAVRSAFEETLLHVTVPFDGKLTFTFKGQSKEEQVTVPIDASTRQPFLSLGFGTETMETSKTFGLYTASNQTGYEDVLRPRHATFDQLIGVKAIADIPFSLRPNERYPLFDFSFMRDDQLEKQYVYVSYHPETLLHGEPLKQAVYEQFRDRDHAIFHDLALVGTEPRDAAFLTHVGSHDTAFIFDAIARAKATTAVGEPAPRPYLTVFKDVRAQTFDVSYDETDVYLTNAQTGSHFKLLDEDASRWHTLFK